MDDTGHVQWRDIVLAQRKGDFAAGVLAGTCFGMTAVASAASYTTQLYTLAVIFGLLAAFFLGGIIWGAVKGPSE